MALVLGLLSAFGPLSIDMYLPSLPVLASDLGTTPSLAQLSLTACMIGLSLGQLVAGPLSDVRGRRGPLLIGLAVYAAASLLCLLAPSIASFVVLRFVQGLAGAAGIVISRAIVRDLYSGTEMTRFFSLLMLINGAAPILAPVIGGQLLRVTSWRGVFVVLGAIGIAMFVVVLLGLRETLSAERRSKGGLRQTLATFRRLLGDRAFMGYALTQGLVTAAMFAYISGSPFVLQNKFGVSPQMYSAFFAVNGLGIIVASQLAGRLAGRVGERRLLLAGLVLAASGAALLLVSALAGGGLALVAPALFAVVSSVGLVSTATFSLAMQNQGQAAGSASALLGLLSFVIGAIVAPMTGLGGSESDLPMATIIALCEAGAVLCYVFVIRRSHSRH